MQRYKVPLLLVLVSCLFYWEFSYDLERSDFLKLLSLYLGLFVVSWKIYQLTKHNFRFLLGAAVLFRLIFIISIPNLSQDFFRFIWDGKLLVQGINPYLFTPAELGTATDFSFSNWQDLLSGMGQLSANNPTNYPPLNQLLFSIAALVGGQNILASILALRIIIILADLGTMFFGRKLLHNLNLPGHRIFWYLLNPFIIIELTGNLHFEGVMVFFLVWSLYQLSNLKWLQSAFLLGLSISIKLLPLIFLPILFRRLGLKKGLIYSTVAGGVNILLFLPFFSLKFLKNYTTSVGLWFQKFEFNASIWYIIRWIGYEVRGYNIISHAGPMLGILVLALILLVTFRKSTSTHRQLIRSMLFSITIYFFLATTVHPWYLATPLILSVFTNYRFVLAWSLVVVLSYSAYSTPAFNENLWLIALEYLVVLGVLSYEFFRIDKEKKGKPIAGNF